MIEYTPGGLAYVKSFSTDQRGTAQKASLNELSQQWSALLPNNSSLDLGDNEWGAALAYLSVHEIQVCINQYVNCINDIPWKIISINGQEEKDYTVISDSDDDLPRHIFHLCMRDFKRATGQSFLGTMMFDRMLYGTIYIELSGGLFDDKELNWLNPLGVRRDIIKGELRSFRYGWESVYETIPAHNVAYYHTRHPYDDFAGYSPVMALMRKINLVINFDRFLKDFFHNNATPHTIFSPEDNAKLMPDKRTQLESQLRAQVEGSGNMHRTIVLPERFHIQQLDLPDLAKFSLQEEVSRKLFEGMGVPQAMAGNTAATSYKEGDETTRRFYLGWVYPIAKELQSFINNNIISHFDRSGKIRFQFDFSFMDIVTEADQLEANVINSQLDNGYISLGEAARRQELPADEWLDSRYMIEGVPMTRQQIDTYIEAKIQSLQNQALGVGIGGDGCVSPDIASEPTEDITDVLEDVTGEFSEDETEYVASHPFLRLYEGKSIYPSDDTISTRIDTELRQWRDFEIKRAGMRNVRDFEHYVTPIYIRHAIYDLMPIGADVDIIKSAFANVFRELRTDGSRLKSISTYQRRLRALVTKLWEGSLSASEARDRMSILIDDQLKLAFEQGVKRAGATLDEIDAEDRSQLTDIIRDEQSHVPDLVEAIKNNSKKEGGQLAPLRARIDLWTSRWAGVSDLAYAIASRGKKLEWVFDPRKEHCRHCLKLNGRVYTGNVWKIIGIYPRSSKLACFGLHCGCNFTETDKPITRGRRPRF